MRWQKNLTENESISNWHETRWLAVDIILTVLLAFPGPLCSAQLNKATILFAKGVRKQFEPNRSEIYKAAEHLSVMVKCPDRLWPNYSWRDIQVVFIDVKQGNAVLWNDQAQKSTDKEPKITLVPASVFSPLSPGSFQFATYQGVTTLLIWWDGHQGYEAMVEFAIHEGFHETGQSNMSRAGRRGDFYPENWHARYLRRELIDSLTRAVSKPTADRLAAAAFWEKKISELYPGDVELNRPTDLREGTAEYIGKLGASLALLGCGSSDGDLYRKARKGLRTSQLSFGKELESYRIGLMAGLLLQKLPVKGWQQRAAKGEDLLDILLSDVKPQEQKEDKKLAAEFKNYYEEKNEQLAGVIESFEHKLTSHDFYVLAMPNSWRVGSYTARQHINFAFNGRVLTVALGTNSHFRKPETSLTVEIHHQDVGFLELGGEISGGYIYFPVARDELQLEVDGTYSVQTKSVKAFHLPAKAMRMEGFTTWLVAQ